MIKSKILLLSALLCAGMLLGSSCHKDKDDPVVDTNNTAQNDTTNTQNQQGEKAKFTITFDSDGGSEVSAQEVEVGKTASKPEDPTKDGYTFYAWYNGDSEYDFTTAVTANLTLKAQWSEIVPKNCIAGVFSVSSSKTVRFSKGNLQYHCKNKTWRFAENQWDYIGDANSNISDSYDGYIDLFGWGMWLEGQTPTNTSTDYNDYLSTVESGDFTGNATIGEKWQTLSTSEWSYLFNSRGDNSYVKASVNGVSGIILLPDNWNTETYTLSSYNTTNAAFTTNEISSENWSTLETAGAVFLPCAGFREGTLVDRLGSGGYYWSSSAYGSSGAWCVYFSSAYVYPNDYDPDIRYYGQSVRLICPL